MGKNTATGQRATRYRPAVADRIESDGRYAPQVSYGRRTFLKQAGAFSAGMISGPVLLQGCGGGGGGGGDAQAAVSSAPNVMQPAAASYPVLAFNATDSAHLLSVDLRSESNLLALNTTYGAGAYVVSGNLVFDAHRGVQATDESSGLVIDLSKILSSDIRRGLATEGQVTVEFESQRIADPWLVDAYTDRYVISRGDPSVWPASVGLLPFSQESRVWRMVAEDGVGGPVLLGPTPESPSGLGTRANNLSMRLHDNSIQDVVIGIHSAAHDEFTSITTAWQAPNSLTAYIDDAPGLLTGPTAVGPHGVQINQDLYTVTDVPANSSPKQTLRLFFGRSDVYIRRLIIGARAPVLPMHPLFLNCASYGDSFTHRGGLSNSRYPVNDLWDAANVYYFMGKLAKYGYRMGYLWNNSLGGGAYSKTAAKSLWNNNGQWDLESLKAIDPSFVMMAASHNDASYIGLGGAAESAEYQARLAQVKADMLEHIEVILTGQSATWTKTTPAGTAKIGIVSAPASPRQPGWDVNKAQAQRDLNAFVLEELPAKVQSALGESYSRRIATFDAASLFGPQHLYEYHPLFEKNGTGTHPNWWGGKLLDYGWWQCALKLVSS